MDGKNFNEEISQQAQESAKRTMQNNTLTKWFKSSGAGRKIGKKAVQATGKLLVAFLNALKSLLLALGPIGIGVLVGIVIFAAAFNYIMDERGSSGQLDLDPSKENPTVMTDEGYRTAVAMTESQALIDAYYKYLSCDSHQKVYVDESGNIVTLQFSNAEQTADFAGLSDIYGKENYFYLSSYFLKMTDELFNNEEFFYPEQFIKPVHYQVLPLKDPDDDESGKLYVTALPLVDDGSDNAKSLSGQISDGPYAIGETLRAADGERLRRVLPDDATKAFLAQSRTYLLKDNVTVVDENDVSHTGSALVDQGNETEPGIWDYGFGSVLQYESMQKNRTIDVSKISFEYHFHTIPWTEEEGEDGSIEKVCGTATCHTAIYEIDLSSDTAASIIEATDNYMETFEEDDGDSGVDVEMMARPTKKQLNYMLENTDGVEMWISSADESLAGVYFDNQTIQAAFGNATGDNKGAMVKKTKYPLNIAVISSAATFSGNIRYKYQIETTSVELTDCTGTRGSIQDNWADDCTTIEYDSLECSSESLSIVRGGTVHSSQPSSIPEEISVPTGFQYVEDYGTHYKIYVPNAVHTDMDFKERVYQKQEGADNLSASEKVGYDVDQDGEVTIMDFLLKLGLLTPYAGGTLGQTGGITQGEISVENQADLAALGCGMDEAGQTRLLAKVIAAEAGPNKLDQLMVGAVVLNRVYSPEFSYADSIIEVISAPGQYESWSNGSIAAREPTPEQLASAEQLLSGRFALPSNIIFQTGSPPSNSTTWMVVMNGGNGLVDHHYCHNGALALTDFYGRTALTQEQIRDLAETLHQEDIANGISSSSGTADSGIAVSPNYNSLVVDTVYNGEKLYAAKGFDVQTALSSMRKISDRESVGFFESIYAVGSALVGDLLAQIEKFFSVMKEALFSNKGDFVLPYSRFISLDDIRNTVIQCVTFSNQDIYSNVAESFDPDILQFLFIGKDGWGGAGQGTNGIGSVNWIPGTGSVFTNFGSPTGTHYNTTSPWNEVSGSATVAIPDGTPVLAVGSSVVSTVKENDDGTYAITMSANADGKVLSITYDNLFSAAVAEGASLSKGDTVGIAGDGGVIIKLLIDGVNSDPMKYFYQPTCTGSAAFVNILNANGYVDENLKQQLFDAINNANKSADSPSTNPRKGGHGPSASSTFDQWHNPANNAIYHTKTVGECTWWAYGRGWQYCEMQGTLPPGGFSPSYGNGGDYYSQASQHFAVGQIAHPGSWIVWAKPGSYGHVAFVEAVDKDGTIYYSESGNNIWYSGDGTGINLGSRQNSGTATNPNYVYSGSYVFVGFVYLDMPNHLR